MTGPAAGQEPDGLVLARLEFKLDAALRQDADHETRLRALEGARWPLPTLAVLVSVASSIIAVVR